MGRSLGALDPGSHPHRRCARAPHRAVLAQHGSRPRVGSPSVTAQSIPEPVYDLPDGYVHVHSGKVRDLYRAARTGRLLMVASDRISAFDFVLPRPSPTRAGS